jgi:hypothetical protein
VTTHRCKDGVWRPGKLRDCETCKKDLVKPPRAFGVKVKW